MLAESIDHQPTNTKQHQPNPAHSLCIAVQRPQCVQLLQPSNDRFGGRRGQPIEPHHIVDAQSLQLFVWIGFLVSLLSLF